MDKSVVIEMLYVQILEAGSQSELAKKWNVSLSYINDVYRGKREPGSKILEKLGLNKIVTYELNSQVKE